MTMRCDRAAHVAATEAVVEYVLSDAYRAGELRGALRAMPQGLPGVHPGAVCRDVVVNRLQMLGLPALDWQRFAKLVLRQLGETGDGYRVRCHVLGLEERTDVYRAQGAHGQAWQGDLVRESCDPPAAAAWWVNPSPVVTLQGYSCGPVAADAPCGEYALVSRPGRRVSSVVAIER